ncbi:oxidoreductase [Roseibacterium sp. SDUM158016]|uniref:NADH-quinone oxidoreductase subunit B family protein n=1 Tax=Roseicyclus sediminis TaxID=2980997 RepID=UPI0021D335EA|nr:oxidoreductase [Roseibacterium sp. SDUM158016]MCU4653944.1 oxidoreductase [Roseibacterium sp. SDUM158016]
MPPRPRLGVFKFSSCDGCQLSLLDCERELLDVAGALEIAYFAEAVSAEDTGHYDVALVEGSVTTEAEALHIHDIRARSTTLVTIGACATSGGIQALKNGGNAAGFLKMVYPTPAWLHTLESATAISDHVKVDHELRGCPISKHQLLELIAALLAGRRPQTEPHATCLECKLAGQVCVMVAEGKPCLGPVTHAGCGALCPGYARGCYGCFGPKETANTASLSAQLGALGESPARIARAFSTFNTNAPEFRAEAEAQGDD